MGKFSRPYNRHWTRLHAKYPRRPSKAYLAVVAERAEVLATAVDRMIEASKKETVDAVK